MVHCLCKCPQGIPSTFPPQCMQLVGADNAGVVSHYVLEDKYISLWTSRSNIIHASGKEACQELFEKFNTFTDQLVEQE